MAQDDHGEEAPRITTVLDPSGTGEGALYMARGLIPSHGRRPQ